MSEKWNLQLRNGVLFGVIYIVIQLLFSVFADSKEEELSELLSQPNFYLKWLIWFLTGAFVIGYFKWKFPLREENKIEKKLNNEADKGNMWNYLINYVVFFVFLMGILNNLDDLIRSSFKKVFFAIIFFSSFGIIFGYVEWKNVDGRYNSWSYVFKRIKGFFKRNKKEIS